MSIAIGIDLGTTYSCVSVYINGKSVVIPNENGNNTTPSWVSFDKNNGTRYVGESAKAQRSCNSTNTIYDIKRLMGQYYDNEQTQHHISSYPYKVVKNEKTQGCLIEIIIGDEKKYFTPEEISAMILLKLKQQAQNYLKVEITNAVITVPAYFNDSQRQATKDAGLIAGLNVLRIINEPTSASIAYGFGTETNVNELEHKFLVYDMGGGTLDVSILNLSNGVFRVIATDGNGHLGGEDFDNRILNYVLEQLKLLHNITLDITTHSSEIGTIRHECEKAKRLLSSCASTKIIIDCLDDDFTEYKITLTKKIFESITNDLFIKAMEPVTRVLTDSKLNTQDIDAVVLVGGSTRLSKIQEMLSYHFNNKELCKSINPDEAVSIGSSISAAILNNSGDDKTKNIVLLDVCPLTLGVETAGEIMTPMILRNTQIPCTKTQTFTTHTDNQTSCEIQIYEGERKLTKHCNLLGKFELLGFRPLKRGELKIDVTYELDTNGILKVSACEKAGNVTQSVVIKNHANRLTTDEINRLIEEAKNYEKEDYIIKKRVESFNQFEKLIYHTELTLKEMENNDVELINELEKVKIWLDGVKNNIDTIDDKELLEYMENFENKVHNFFANVENSSKNSKYDKIEQILSTMTPEQRKMFEQQILNEHIINVSNDANENLKDATYSEI